MVAKRVEAKAYSLVSIVVVYMEFTLLETRRLTGNRQVNIPENVRDLVVFEHEVYGKMVQWNVDETGKVAILSMYRSDLKRRVDHSLRDRNYIPITKSSLNNGGSTITLIQDVCEEVDWSVSRGDLVCYLAHEEMCEGKMRSIFVISGKTALDIVRRGVVEDDDYRNILSMAPE